MEPVYMNMPPYPHQDPMHYRPRCHSGMEARPPMSYGCWPWAGHYGYAAPAACHGCSNHAYMPPPYEGGSPYSHVPPYHCAWNYPYFPAQYMPPPPYNVMEHPRYEYEKNVPMEHHCCGCSNHHHQLYPQEQKAVRIEEEEPEKDRRRNDSLVPLQFKTSPYPIAWLPPDHEEHGKAEGGKDGKVHENRKTAEQQLPFLKGWLPVDLNNVVSSKQRGDGGENDHQDGGMRNFQFPLFWIPYNYKPDDMDRESHKVKDVNPKPSLESEKVSDGEQKSHLNSGKVGDQTASRGKDIPVKEAEQDVGKESSIFPEKKRDASVKDTTHKGEKKIDTVGKVSPTDGSKRKSPSPPKSSKLPPVCLRVDPLPRKKSVNGKSRSPSPPGDKQKLEVKSDESSRAYSSDNREQVKDAKTIAVVNGNASPEKSMNVNVETPVNLPAESQDDASVKQEVVVKQKEEHVAQKNGKDGALVKEQSEDIICSRRENEEPVGADGVKVDEVKKCRDLSEEEAAIIIQSAFRRFDVCRWKPIEKLKQIARVREQIGDVKRLIHDLELSSDIQGRAKQKNIISETIMSLLLKLDTIQGLHPSIREIRKSVVKELVSLQEQLDSLMIEKSVDSPKQEAMSRCDNEDASNKNGVMKSENDSKEINSVDLQSQIDEGSKSQEANLIEEEAEILRTGMEEVPERCIDEGVMRSENDSNEINSVDIQSQIDDGSKSEEANLIEEEAAILKTGMEEASERSMDEGVVKSANGSNEMNSVNLQNQNDEGSNSEEENSNEEAAISKIGMEGASESSMDEKSSKVLQNNEASIAEEDNEPIIPVQGSELSSLQDDHNVIQSELTELPQGVLDDLYTAEGTNNSTVKADSSECDQSNQQEEEPIGSPSVEELHHETADKENHRTMEAHEALDLPLNGTELKTEEAEICHETADKENYSMEAHEALDLPLNGTELRTKEAEICGAETPQQPVNLTADLVEPSEEGKLLHDEKPHEIFGSMMEEQKQLDFVLEEGDLEKTSVINEHVNASGALNAEEVEMGMASKQCNTEHRALTEEELEGVVEGGEDIKESNRRLMEENQRLREMMEKLIKSGQEQVRAISSLSGRVKDMEMKLTRKKKLKVKQFRAPRSSKFDAFVGDGKTT